MSEATGSLSFWDLVIEVATRKYRGIQKVRDWPTEAEITGTATGVYSDSTTTFTATAAIFYETMVGGTVTFDGTDYTVASYTSTTEITVTASAAGDTKVITFPEEWDDHTQAEFTLAQQYINDAKAIVNAGYKRFLIAHDWGFLTTRTTLTGWATATGEAKGAPSYSNPLSTVTSDEAMFYPSMVGQTLLFDDSEDEYVITAYTNSKVIVVSGNASDEKDEAAMTVTTTGTQRLPDDFGGQMIDEKMYFAPDGLGNAIQEVPMSDILNMRAGSNTTAQYPWMYGLETVQVGDYTRWNVAFWPRWATDTTIHYRYRKQITLLTSDADGTTYPLGGAEFSTAIREACLMMVEEDRGFPKGPAHESYNVTLAQAILRDSKNKPRNRGYNRDNSDSRPVFSRHPIGIITHERG